MGLVVILLLASTLAQNPPADLSWLTGHWILVDGTKTSEEIWTNDSGGLMLGVNRTVIDDMARAFEFLRIHRSDEATTYCAQPNGSPATCFVMVEADDRSVVFENAENDFPQRISYRRNGAELIATISDLEGTHEMQWRWTKVAGSPEGR